MSAAIVSFLQALKLAPAQTAGGITIVPLCGAEENPPEYLALTEALQQKQVEITEVDQGGSVPELIVINHGGKPVLLLDGEELAGAKQNRVLNTTILIAGQTKTIIPVSCSEQGRWHYTSLSFASSGNVMSSTVRRRKSSSVTESLKAVGSFQSDQCEVWNEIAALHEKSGTSHLSSTGAMSDVYDAKKKDLDELASAFALVERQTGILVLRDGRVEGCDVISRPVAYRQIHDRLVRSYVMESLVEQPTVKAESVATLDPLTTALAFLSSAAGLTSTSHKSPGVGEDHRLAGPHLAGSALIVDGRAVHVALFPVLEEAKGKAPSLASLQRRRRYRGL